MSFMDKITSRPRDARADTGAYDSQFDDVVTAYPEGAGSRHARRRAAARRWRRTRAPTSRRRDSSIISEVTPSELAGDFSETRLQDSRRPTSRAQGAALPLIGHLRAAAAAARAGRRWSLAGLLGLALTTVLALSSASRNSEQVGSIGQALMESQRLAKSVSQAMVGVPAAFPEAQGKRRGAGAQRARAGRRRVRRRRCRPRCSRRWTRCCRWSTAPTRTPPSCWRSRRR